MKTEIIKSFSSFGCDAELSLVTFDYSKQCVYQVFVRFCVTPQDWNSNYQVFTFGEDEHSARECFRKFVKESL